jgi:hypothetical protein
MGAFLVAAPRARGDGPVSQPPTSATPAACDNHGTRYHKSPDSVAEPASSNWPKVVGLMFEKARETSPGFG